MPRSRRSSQQTPALKIESAEAKVAKTRAAHKKAVDELKKLYNIHSQGTTAGAAFKGNDVQQTVF